MDTEPTKSQRDATIHKRTTEPTMHTREDANITALQTEYTGPDLRQERYTDTPDNSTDSAKRRGRYPSDRAPHKSDANKGQCKSENRRETGCPHDARKQNEGETRNWAAARTRRKTQKQAATEISTTTHPSVAQQLRHTSSRA